MARPRKEPEITYTHHINLRLTDVQYEIISENARHFNTGGIHSLEMRKAIGQGLSDIFRMKEEVLKTAGDFQQIRKI
ncbi:MAG: hypothetical protein Q4C91_05580 [Eubacteriales bacterium]|nr:hypothetical protein [Eubacteriales bacterium]